jgi:hypothetical protein
MVMKFTLSIIVLACFIISSCSSLDSVKKNPNCVVWKDQKYLGPYSIEVVEKKIEWTKGRCPGKKAKCEPVNLSLDENGNVFRDAVNIGKINNNEFLYTVKDGDLPLITYTSMRTYPETSEVKGAVLINNVPTETVYQYNQKCSPQEAILGGIALGLIAQIQNKN